VEPLIPAVLEKELRPVCRQVVLVLADAADSVSALLRRLERRGDNWVTVGKPIRVSLGRKGLAWGLGEHSAPPPPGYAIKREGDGCSPAGVFRIGQAFGYAAQAPSLQVPYLGITATHIAVDDPQSRHYNQIVDSDSVACDWTSKEMMLREDGLYRWGAVIGHNPANVSGAGSCIFFHLWRGPGHPTAGCTAMAEEDLRTVLEWLSPAAEPRLVQAVAAVGFAG
jgi:L,D-peptidoglycan transpeptidase YkuD (ErfK/YbiS/YcfS/YnhG family)